MTYELFQTQTLRSDEVTVPLEWRLNSFEPECVCVRVTGQYFVTILPSKNIIHESFNPSISDNKSFLVCYFFNDAKEQEEAEQTLEFF